MPATSPKRKVAPQDPVIYNCHIHTFTRKHVPRDFLKFQYPRFGAFLSWFLRLPLVPRLADWVIPRLRPFLDLNAIERQLRFVLKERGSQMETFKAIQEQYPLRARFVVLPMDMALADLGPVQESIDEQHAQLLEMARASRGHAIPFYAVDPRRKDIVEHVRDNLSRGEFRGVKIYPNLGYPPFHPVLMKVYEICVEWDVPVMTHCSQGGVWMNKLTEAQRIELSHPSNYRRILKKYPELRLCLAHFGGADQLERAWSSSNRKDETATWVRWIASMIKCGRYPNLYTDISYTLFMLKPMGFYFDYFDYVKVLLSNQNIREHVLFGSDYYMIEREPHKEKEISIGLRSRLGDELFFQIAHTNPMKYLGIGQKKKNGKRPAASKLARE